MSPPGLNFRFGRGACWRLGAPECKQAMCQKLIPNCCRPTGDRFVVLIYGTVRGRVAPAARDQRNFDMRFMYIVLSPSSMAPTPALIEAMGKLADREIKAGRMI